MSDPTDANPVIEWIKQSPGYMTFPLKPPPLASLQDYLTADAIRLNLRVPSGVETPLPGIYILAVEEDRITLRDVGILPLVPPTTTTSTAQAMAPGVAVSTSYAPIFAIHEMPSREPAAVSHKGQESVLVLQHVNRNYRISNSRLHKPYLDDVGASRTQTLVSGRNGKETPYDCAPEQYPDDPYISQKATGSPEFSYDQRHIVLSPLEAGLGAYTVEMQFNNSPRLGLQTPELMVDTGSSLTWNFHDGVLKNTMPWDRPKHRFVFQPTPDYSQVVSGRSFKLGYQEGSSINFYLYKGPLSFKAKGIRSGNAWAVVDSPFVFGSVFNANDPLAGRKFDGILGLSPIAQRREMDQQFVHEIESLPWHLKKCGYISEPKFTISLAAAHRQEQKSILHFGPMPSSLRNELGLHPWSDWVECPVNTVTAGCWALPLTSITVMIHDTVRTTSKTEIDMDGEPIMLDSGTTSSYLPHGKVEEIHKAMNATLAVPGRKSDGQHFIWNLPENVDNVLIQYKFRARQDPGVDPGPPVIVSASGRHLACRPTIDARHDPRYSALKGRYMGENSVACLGAPFFTRFAVEFDATPGHPRVRFAYRKGDVRKAGHR